MLAGTVPDEPDVSPAAPACRGFIYAPYTSAESPVVPSYWVQRYEDEAARYWDQFYTRNADRFFKDRHYLGKEWSELKPQDEDGGDDDGATDERAEVSSLCAGDDELVLLEAGCGAGNTMLPLMRANPRLRVYAFDFAEVAVRLVQADPLYETGRIVAVVGDLTAGELPAALAGCKAHLCTLMFVLSAISEPKMAASLRAISSGLRDGGLVLFRDYAEGDGAQQRLRQAKGAKQLDDSARFFVRQDGTRAYYFSVEQLCSMWTAAGFDVLRCEYSARQTVNRQKGLTLERCFVTAKFRKRPGGQASQQPLPTECEGATATGTESHFPAAPHVPPEVSRGPHRPTLALPPAAPTRPEAPSLPQAATPGGVAASGVEADRVCAWSEAKLQVHQCLRDALGPGASAAQRSRLLDEVRCELGSDAVCLDTQASAAVASTSSVGEKH